MSRLSSAPDRARLEALVAGVDTISDKIRALDRAGLARAEIARFLGRRYQHVRNVLEGDKLARTELSPRSGPGPGAKRPTAQRDQEKIDSYLVGPGAEAAIVPLGLRTGPGGELTLPGHLMRALGIGRNELVGALLLEGELRVLSHEGAAARVRPFLDGGADTARPEPAAPSKAEPR